MKSLFFLSTLILTLIVTSGCNKSANKRERYVGTWEMTITSNLIAYTVDMSGNTVTNYYTNTSVNSNVEISIDESDESRIIIDFYPNSINSYENKVTLSENGQFSKCCSPSVSCEITGSFTSKKEMRMEMQNWGHCNGASAGGTSHQTVTGKKK